MGLGQSKVDPYILHVQGDMFDDKVNLKSSYKHSGKHGNNNNNNANNASNNNTNNNTNNNVHHVARIPSIKEHQESKDPKELANNKEQQLIRQMSQSSTKLNQQRSSNKLLDRGSSTSKLISTASQSKLAHDVQTKVSLMKASQKGGRGHEQVSPKYPWLLKSIDLTGANLSEFEFGRVIGCGLMGTCRVCKIKTNQKYFVLKSVKKEFINKHNDHRHIQHEREILLALHSPFCIRLFGTFQDRVNVYFALEYAPGGELFHRLDRKKSFAPNVAKFYATEIFCALEHIQSKGFVYRDLKPENIILDEDGHCKIIDFGFARPCGPNDRMHTMCGTPAYLSPEQLDGKLTNGYTRIVDWWSYGVLIYELLTGTPPFCTPNTRESHYEIFLRILKKKISFPRSFDQESKDLVSLLCHPQVDKRLCDAQEIKKHPYYVIAWEDVVAKRLVPPFVPKLKDDGDDHYFDKYHDPGLPVVKSDELGPNHGHFDF